MSLEGAFREQATHNRTLGSPFTARVLRLAAERAVPGNPVMDRMLAWKGDIGPLGASLPLRFLSGLHALVLTGACPALIAAFPPNPAPDDKTLGAAIDAALAGHQDVLMRWIDNPPQTNEVRRASVMIAAGQWMADRFGLPFVLSELGASAGLNLMWDKFCLALACGTFGPKRSPVWLDPDWRGPCPPAAEVKVLDRRGVDLRPMDPHDAEDALRLISFLWADQPQRIDRTRAAIAMAAAPVDKGDAAGWLEARLAETHPGALHLVTHTVAWQYFPAATRTRCLAAFEAAGARATRTAPLARLSMEADNSGKPGAAITLTLWPGSKTISLGRVDFHARWVDWTPP